MKIFFLPLLLLAVNFCSAQVNLNLGLRAYYPFSGNANDVSGNNNNPVFNNATLTADRFGNPNSAYHFNGTNQYMRIANSASINTTNKLSLVAWVKVQGFYAGTCHGNSIIMKGDADGLTGNYLLRFDDGPFTNGNNCSVPVNPANQNFYGAGSASNPPGYMPYIQTNQWYCVVATYDGTTAKLYVNCELKVSRAQTITSFTNSFDVFLGRLNSAAFPYWFNGDMDEVRIYDRALNIDEVNVLGGCITQTPCNNWLNTPSNPSYARIGDLDVSGNQLTIEATYNRTQPLNSGLFPGHLVSKHTGTSDVNYALFPNGCAITTTTGYKETFENCALDLNKTYHVAMVYDGSFLKFYRNGFLHSQVACTGNMILNNLQATLAQYAGGGIPDAQFLGHMNEVRIWNVARTQAQLQTYMNNSLPNPTTIPGLLGYYTFDNLINKQGNAAFNATLVGAATINGTNTNCTFVADSCIISPCDSWLRTQVPGQSVKVGDLDVSGNQMTIEGNFNCIAFPPPGNGNIWEEIISKHHGVADCNYALRMNMAAITTTNGFFRTPSFPSASCDSILLNKTYHAAMVYDGITLKFYRNGFLMSQIAATGNLVLNNLLATIGDYASVPQQGTNFQGYLNEIRVWNVARTQTQIQTYMNSSLPNPTTQTGLLGYYTFDNLINKQGNATFNGALNGGATINNTNPNCTFIADSCVVSSCNSWLRTQAPGQSVKVGDLDITGNLMTIEANFNCSSFPVNRPDKWEDIVSKHSNTTDANYVLRMDLAAITTTTGHYLLSPTCDSLALNKTYHVALVYNGSTLKFYRNGFLMGQMPVTGNLVTNNLLTTIGDYAVNNPVGTNFLGYINEVRIWNVERTQAQLQTYMNSSLPNPTTLTGLQGYYTFDNLLNKQGNATYNGVLTGGATINNTNPNCAFTADSCVTLVSNDGCKGVIELHGNDCVRLPLSQDYYANTGFTWETWFNSHWFENNDNSLRLGQSLIMSEDVTLCEDIQLGFGWQNIPRNAIGFVVDAPGQCGARDNNPVFYRPPGGFLPNTWYHVAGVRNYSTNQTQLYFNGQLVDTKTNTGAPFSRNILTRIGTYTVAQDSGFAGKMDEIRIWKRPRSAAEISADYYKCLTGTETGLVAYYKSNEHNGLVLHNIVNNPALNGTLDATVNWNNTINAPLINNCGTPVTSTINITICRGLSYEGHTISGTYRDTFPAANGCDSIKILNLTVLANIDSVRINNTNACLNINFNGLAYTNTSPVSTWQWYFGDGGTANTQNTSHTYTNPGVYLVKLVVTDINGCKDSITKNITTTIFVANAGNDTAVCTAPAVSVTLHASAGSSYSWTPVALLNNPAVQHPVATISATTTFYVTITNATGCTATDSVIVTLTPALIPAVTISSSANNICTGIPITFTAVAVNGGSPPSFQWQKNGNPVGTNSNTYTGLSLNNGDVIRCILTSNLNCAAPATIQSNSITMAISSAPANMRYPTLNTFPYKNLQLQARSIGGTAFQWLPNVGLNNNTIFNPVFYYSQTQEYTVRINTGAGCIVIDTQLVEIKGKKGIYVPDGFTPNSDGNNDRLYPILVGIKKLNYFKVYNRWGNLLFETTSGRPEDGWDGTYKGKKQPVETYMWVVEGIDIDNITIRKNGNTLLIH